MPTNTTKMSLWVLKQENLLKKMKTLGDSLPGTLLRELDLNEQQISQLQQRSIGIRGLTNDLRESLRMVEELKGILDEKQDILGNQMAEIQQILTPTQIAKFTVWVKNNAACMAMLARLW
jgi:hypothetical protein